MSGVAQPVQFLPCHWTTPIDIALVPAVPLGGTDGKLLTVQWTAKYGTSNLPYDPEVEDVK